MALPGKLERWNVCGETNGTKANNVAAVMSCFHRLSSPNNHKPSKLWALSSSLLWVCAQSPWVQRAVGTEGREEVSFSCGTEWHRLLGEKRRHNVNMSPGPFAQRNFWSIPQFAFFFFPKRARAAVASPKQIWSVTIYNLQFSEEGADKFISIKASFFFFLLQLIRTFRLV